jgi:DNA-binding HxlR family transcriptional regulator
MSTLETVLRGVPAADVVQGDCFNTGCVAREAFNHVTGRWGGLVLAALNEGTMRFSALRARVGGISEKMLAQTVRDLERDGFVVRRAYAEIPPRVEYELTDAGREVARRLYDLATWLAAHARELLSAQQKHDERRDAGASV